MVVVALTCAFVREPGGVFGVKLDDSAQVWELKDAIAAKLKYTGRANQLQLFLAKKGDAWLPDDDPAALALDNGVTHLDVQGMIDGEKMKATWTLENVLTANNMTQPKSRQIHVLVVAPGQHQLTSIAGARIHEPHPARKKRWEELNEVLDRNKRAKVNSAGESSTGYSYVSFNDVDRVMRARRYEQPSKVIENDKIDVLHAYLLLLTKAFGEIVTGKEAKRLHFIVPILACVCGLFNGDVRILAEETVVGKRVHGDGSFEFVIERGSQRVCIVEAKRDDFQQGLAQAYVGCEALADVEGLSKLYSIVTNYKEWYFSRSLDDRVERYDATITIVNDVPTRESVKMIAEKIYSMLSDDYQVVASNEALQ